MSRKTRGVPQRIVSMINTRRLRGMNAKQISKEINSCFTAKQLGVEFSYRSVAAIMANITMGNYSL